MATLFLLLFSLSPLWAQNMSSEAEFKQKKGFMNSRFEDFFSRQMQIQRNNELREKSAVEMGPIRNADEKKREKAREDYVRTRPKPQDKEPARISDEKARAAEVKKMSEYQKSYAQRQRELERLFSTSRKVPPEYDSGLKDPAVD